MECVVWVFLVGFFSLISPLLHVKIAYVSSEEGVTLEMLTF